MKYLSFILLFLFSAVTHAQNLETRNLFGTVLVYENGKRLSAKKIEQRLSVHPEAHALFQKARKSRQREALLGLTGGLLMLVPVVTNLNGEGGTGNDALFHAAGAGIVLMSLPLTISWNRKTRAAVKMYNQSGLTHFESRPPIQLGLSARQGQMGLQMTF